MADIIRIIIEGESGYSDGGCFHDKMTIDHDSIRYESEGFMERDPENWSYKTNSPIFQELFTEAASAVVEILNREKEDKTMQVCDGGVVTFTVIYADKTEATRDFLISRDHFKECFAIIKKMVPGCEETPSVLWTSEDEDDEGYEDEDYEEDDDDGEE